VTRSLQPELKEFAATPPSPWGDYDSGRRLAEPIVRSEGYAGHGTPYALFAEMEDKDPHLFSALQTRKLGVLARKRTVEPAGDGERERAIAGWVEQTLQTTPGWQAGLLHLLDALGKGMAVLEVLWGFDGAGRIVPRALKPRAAERFVRDADGGWRLLRGEPGIGVYPGTRGEPLPPRKFVFALFGADDERPYGKGLCERVYWLWWFKKHNLKFWLVYNEKFGSPTVVARHRAGLGESERARLLEVIDAIHNDAGVTLPEGIELELLEAGRAGGGDSYRELAQWCNDEISRAILGQTLTASEGERSGSLALGRVHEAVRRDYMRADAWLLMEAVNAQLARWLVDFNWGEEVPAPRWTIDLAEELDLEAEVRVDRQLLQMGVSLPEGYFYEKYGRPAPQGDGRRLQYDDSNLYQYHLQFGILTVNEVRAKLGLAPVTWGERPTSPAADAVRPPTPSTAAGEPPSREQRAEAERGEREKKGK
jgi:phage gp29-like protein